MDASLRRSDVYSGLNEIEYAKAVARKMFENYDTDRSNTIDSHEITPMMQDVYRGMRDSYFPSKNDIEGYSKILDRNSDGKVTLADLEALCIKYLVSPSALSSQSTVSPNKYGESVKKSYLPGSYLSQSPERTTYDAYGAPNARSYDAPTNSRSYDAPTNTRSYDVSPSKKEADKRSYTPGDYLNRSPYAGEDLKRSYTSNVEGLRKSPSKDETDKRVSEILARSTITLKKAMISQIRRVFDKFDEDKNGFIDERELKKLMEETYRILGLKKEVTYSDIQSYLSLVDTNRDGLISYPEYEEIVTRALAKINVRFE
jgi:Ca2+-binding EF-hand superfamily protein